MLPRMAIDRTALADACFEEFGETATYTPSGGVAASVSVITEHNADFAPGGADSNVIEQRTVLHIKKAEVANPGRGDTCVIDGTTYTVDQKVYDDGYIVKAVVR